MYCNEGQHVTLTVTDRVAVRRALDQLYLGFLVADGAGQARLEGALAVRVGIVHTLLTHGVVLVFTVRVHTLPHRANRAGLAATGNGVEEVVVVAITDGVVGVGAGSL